MFAKVPTAPEMAHVAISRRLEAFAVARELRPVARELEPEGHGLGMDAVAAPDRRGHLVLLRARLERREQPVDRGEQQRRGLVELHREAGVEHVRRRHALVHEARGRPDMLGEVGEEGDDVVLGLALDRVDALDLPLALLPDLARGAPGDDPEGCLRVAGMGLDLEPDAESVLGLPDGGHLGAAVAGDHVLSPFVMREEECPWPWS
jgi:hypothetical protein